MLVARRDAGERRAEIGNDARDRRRLVVARHQHRDARLRRRLADEAHVPAYVVFSDATLREMAATRPQSDAELLAARVQHAQGLGDAAAIAVLRPGLEWVVALPFSGTSYLWTDAEGLASSLVLLVTGAACRLAEHYLAIGDVDGVYLDRQAAGPLLEKLRSILHLHQPRRNRVMQILLSRNRFFHRYCLIHHVRLTLLILS